MLIIKLRSYQSYYAGGSQVLLNERTHAGWAHARVSRVRADDEH